MATDTEQKIFDYLDCLEIKGDPIPTVRVMCKDIHVSPNAIAPAIKLWKARKEEAKAKEIAVQSAKILNGDVEKKLNDAFDSIRSLVVQATQNTLATFEEEDKKRAEAALQKEADFHLRIIDLETKTDTLLQDNGFLKRELEVETETRKAKERQIEELRSERDKLETQLEGVNSENKRLLQEQQKHLKEIETLRQQLEEFKAEPNRKLF